MAPLTSSAADRFAGDQARELRALVTRKSALGEQPRLNQTRRCRSVSILSGKGGVGKSVVALNLAITLARRGDSVCLWDASPGLGSLSLLCGQNGYWNLQHVLAGSRTLDEIVLHGPSGIQLIPGASHLLESLQSPGDHIVQSLAEHEHQCDWLIIDSGVSASTSARQFARSADCVLLVTTPETTSVAETYAAMKTLASAGDCTLSLVVNQSESEQQATVIMDRLRHAARTFLRSDVGRAGFIPRDDAVCRSVSKRQPFMETDSIRGPAQQAYEQIADRIRRTVVVRRERSFVEGLMSSAAALRERGVTELEGVRPTSQILNKNGPVSISGRNKVN